MVVDHISAPEKAPDVMRRRLTKMNVIRLHNGHKLHKAC